MPDVSVTITPTGQAYQAAREIIGALCSQCSCREQFEPHVTVQYAYDVPDVDLAVAILEPIFHDSEPFEIQLGEIGVFEGIGVHARIEPTAELYDLYANTRDALNAIGIRTYEYDRNTWVPHLSLSCRHWSSGEAKRIREMFGRLDLSWLARRVQVNALEGDRWVVLRDVALGRAGVPSAA